VTLSFPAELLAIESETHACARRRHVEKLDAVARLAAGLSTELTPLVRSAGTTVQELQQAYPHDAALHGQLDQVREALQRSAVVLRHLESVGRSAQRPVTAVDINAVIEKLRPLLPRLAGPFVTLREDLAPMGAWTSAELGQLEQMLLALVVNARDAMPLGGELTITTRQWTLAAPRWHRHGELRAGEWSVVQVRDTGAGMDADTMDRLFEPFHTTKAPGTGSGLALASVYGMVQQRGGQVLVAANDGPGTSVSICLPVAAALPQANAVADGEAVLVVDDDEWVRNVTARVLRRAGYGVLEAHHGMAALELLRDVAGQCVGTVLADVHMPRLDGHGLAQVVRRERPAMRVVLMTGDSGNWDEAQRVLRKPFTAGELLAAIQAPLVS
jgi:nitrogen-specific signal transduction histidine kinase